ncbi:MAG: type II secretion system protein [Lentisphaerae bacterium]|nr:type II secretion system protein [Lentisphaerota bacterium]
MKTRSFTLIEVVVALAILSISIAGLLQLLTAAQNRIIKVDDHWMRTHMLIQAAEYYMLMKQEDPPAITDTFFPYDDYRVDVIWEEIEGLPEEYTGLTNQKQLRAMVLSLVRQQDGHEVDKIIIDRLDYENASSAE